MGVIIVGVDGSDTATQAAMTAARMAAAFGKELKVVSAYGKFEVETVGEDEELTFSTASEARSVADSIIEKILAEHPGLEVSAQAAGGKPAVALLSVAASTDADMIVVGNKRVQGAARLLGSVATDVARKAPCDVYVAHTHDR